MEYVWIYDFVSRIKILRETNVWMTVNVLNETLKFYEDSDRYKLNKIEN